MEEKGPWNSTICSFGNNRLPLRAKQVTGVSTSAANGFDRGLDARCQPVSRSSPSRATHNLVFYARRRGMLQAGDAESDAAGNPHGPAGGRTGPRPARTKAPGRQANLWLGGQPPRAPARLRDRRRLRAGCCRSRRRHTAGVPASATNHQGRCGRARDLACFLSA